MRRGLVFLLVFFILLAAPTLYRLVRFYQIGGGDALQPPVYDPAEVVQVVPTPASFSFVDNPEVGEALVLLDRAHGNQFTADDLRFLDGRLAARGITLREYSSGDLRTQLRGVTAFVVITPVAEFTSAEVTAVIDFVARGGRLLLIGDPTRYNLLVEEDLFTFNVVIESDEIPLNSLANAFDIIFKGDYLYNTLRNEGNFRNIILEAEGFADGDMTTDLERLVFYGSHSLQVGPAGTPLLRGDDDTWSSSTDRPGGLVLAATSADGRVLALGDINFLTEPYYTVYDNSQFIARIADFLAASTEREYVLTDFPYFLAEEVNLVYIGDPALGPDAFDEIITMQDVLREAGVSLSLSAEPEGNDTIYLGLYNQSAEVVEFLEEAGIELLIDPPLLTAAEEAALEDKDEAETEETPAAEDPADEETPANDEEEGEEPTPTVRLISSSLGSVQMSGTALFLFLETGGERQVVVLAASKEGLENSVARLLDLVPLDAGYVLADCLLQGSLALCPSNVDDEIVEAELLTGGEPDGEKDEEEDDSAVEEEEDEEDSEEGDEEPPAEIDAVNQGSIAIGETVEGEMAVDEQHAWTFSQGPAVIDVTLVGNDELDGVLELYGPDNELLYTADSGFTGDVETIAAADIPDDGEYTIVVRDYFDSGGSYSLTITEVSETSDENGDDEEPASEFRIFIFEDDDGEPLSTGFTSTARLRELLETEFMVEVWTSTADGPLPEDLIADVDFLIWDSGDYQTVDSFADEDLNTLFEYLDSGKPIFITGASPALFGTFDTSLLLDVEIGGEDEVLLNGFTLGETITLVDPVTTVFSEFLFEDVGEDSVAFFLRGPQSEERGSVVGVATDDAVLEQRSIVLLLPFVSLPDDVQEQLFANALAWFEIGEG